MEGWNRIELDKVIRDFIVPMRDKPTDLNGEIPWCRIEDLENSYLYGSKTNQGVDLKTIRRMNLKVFPENTLIVSCSANLGICAITKRDLVTNQTFIGLIPFDNADVKFLYYVMSNEKDSLNLKATGTTIKYLSRQQFEKYQVYIPLDIKEQQGIASILSTIDKNIELTEQLIAKQKNIKTGLMHDLLSYGIDEKGQIRSPKTHSFVEKNRIVVPEEWDVEEIGNNLVKITTGNSNTQDKIDDGIYPLFVRSNTIERSNNYIFEGEAVLTSGDGVGVGKIFHYYNGKFNFHQRVYCISDFKEDKLFGKYFFEYFKTHFLSEVSKQSAKTTVDSVRLNMITKMKIKLPTYIEQKKIVSIIDKQDQIISEQEIKLEKLKSVKKGLMEDLLTGNVRVNY